MYMKQLYYLFFCVFISLFSLGQTNLFVESDSEAPLLTHDSESQLVLSLNIDYFNDIKTVNPCDIVLRLPFFNNSILRLELSAYNAYTDDFQLLRNTENGIIYDNYKPDLLSYKIKGDDGFSGSISFMKNMLIGVVKKDGQVYEIKSINNNLYVLFDVNQSIAESDFTCHTNTDNLELQTNNQSSEIGGGCLEMGIEIDYYTYNQFNQNCYDAVEWALALLAGVNEVYDSELSSQLDSPISLEARYINVWEIEDIYDPLTDCGDMLDAMPTYWNNPPFSEIYAQTDLVHLFSRKNANGGIAWVGALCQGGGAGVYGFGVTTGLNTSLTYDYPNNIPYSYNLSYLGHEIGHNVGASHTHNCEWNPDVSLGFPGGAIDGCADVEGNCDTPADIPNESWQQSFGTIMSYCDLGSGGITLEFHPIVENQALIPGINNANCITTCDDIETSCGNSIYGCTDSIAENFNPNANINDDSCQYIYGCMSPNADNYNSSATMDDGSCICSGEITLFLETDYYSNEVGWELLDDSGNVITSIAIGDYFQGGITVNQNFCLAEGCYEFNIYDEWGDGLSSDNTAGNTPDYYILSIDGSYLVQMNDTDYGQESLNPFCLVICDADVDGDDICDEDEIFGCTNSNYFEYNSAATEEDGSCITLIIEGCTDVIACNYDEFNNLDDGSCNYPLTNFDCDGNCLSDINNDGVCDLFGCMNIDACNYNIMANIDDDTCQFPLFNFDCDGNCLVNIDCAGECGGLSILDECGICNGDNTTCLGCTDMLACNYDNNAILEDNSCDYPLTNFDCDGNCVVNIDCTGECGGLSTLDECGECNGNGPEDFFDCDGNCLLDMDLDGVCDQIDNCIEDYNPSQIDNDNDGYGDECSCQYINIIGDIVVDSGSYQVYTLSANIDNTASWEVSGGNVVWNSANEPSIGVQWLGAGDGTVSITQFYGDNETCVIEFNVAIIPSSINLSENMSEFKKITSIKDVLGRDINNKIINQYIFYFYEDGSVEKIYQINK